MSIHPTAVVEAGARLGSGVKVGPFCYIQKDTEIGDDGELQSHVTVLAHTTLGRRCQVHAGAVLGGAPQDHGFKGDVSCVRIGDDCVLRESVTVNRGTKPGTATIIGDRCMLMANAHCAHNVELGTDVTIANSTALAGYVTVGDRAFISGTISIHQFVRIGRLAMVGLTAVLTKDLPPFCLIGPGEVSQVGGMNIIGMRRAGMSAADRAAVKTAFKTLFRSGLNVQQALARLDEQAAVPVIKEMADFIRGSKRGICGSAMARPTSSEDGAGDE